MEPQYFYKIVIDKPYYFNSLVKMEDENEIIQYALDNWILEPDDGAPWLHGAEAYEVSSEEYKKNKN